LFYLLVEQVSSQFSVIDLEVDCFREEEKELAQLPAFAALNRHIMVLAYEAKDLPARADDAVTDPYVTANDRDWQFEPQRSSVVKARPPSNVPFSAALNVMMLCRLLFSPISTKSSSSITWSIGKTLESSSRSATARTMASLVRTSVP